MAVPGYEIYISDLANPSFHFVNNDIKEPSSIQNVDIIGGKLSIDTFAVNVFYRGEDIDGLRTLPFGTPVWYFKNGALIYKFYINLITRVSKIEFKLECVSSIGLLDKSSHVGGVYTGQTVEEVLDEIIGNIVEYSVDEDVASTKVFGYLPYQSRRENLHQLMFAHNISILRDADGDMRFTFLRSEENPDEIDSDRIYIDGRVEYPAVATEVYVVEHSYQFDDSEEEVTLFDNTSSAPANHKRVIFDTSPIYVPSLYSTDSMVIEVAHPNFVVVSGIGTVHGIPYYDNMSSVSRTNESSGEEYTVAIKDATLVNVLNSEFVAERIMAYYSSAKIVKGDIKIANEATGHRYTFLDAFGEQVTGYLHKITTYASSFVKATSEFITGYQSLWFGNNYTNYIEVTEPCDIIVPEGCTKIRFVIIGGGEGGTYGTQSTTNSDWIHSSEMNAGEPGKAGEPGDGGNIREIVINDPTPGAYHCSIGTRGTGTTLYHSWNLNLVVLNPTASSVTCPDETVYSSDDSNAYKCASGVMNIFTSNVYAKMGKEGIDGGQGGRGSYSTGEDGEDVYYDGVLYTGGKGAKEYTFNFNHTETVVEVGGGGGSGAMAYVNGGSARRSSTYSHVDETASRGAADYEIANLFISIPNGTTGQVPEVVTDRACGGNAGCGAASIGGPGSKGAYDDDYYNQNNKLVYRHVRTGAEPGPAYDIDDFYYIEWRHGTPGRDGGRGIIIVYADKPIEIENVEKMPTPVLTALSGASSSAISFKATNLVEGNRYFVEKKILSVGPNDAGIANMNYQKYMNLGIWEPRGYFDVPSGDTEYDFTDDFGSLYYHIAPVQNATYLYRIKSYGTEELGESDYSNELVVGFGLDQYEVNPLVAVIPVYHNNKVEMFAYTGDHKPNMSSTIFENSQRRAVGEIQWYDVFKYASNLTGVLDAKDLITGSELEYRLYVSGPDKLASQFSNSISGVVPELTNKLLSPYLLYAEPYNSNGFMSTVLWYMICDSRAEEGYIRYNYVDRSWWLNVNPFSISADSEVQKFGRVWALSPATAYRHTYKFKLYTTAENYENSDDSTVLYTEPDNLLKWFEEADWSVENGNVTFIWTEIDHAASYEIKRKAQSETSYTTIFNSSALTFTDTTATYGDTYTYIIVPKADTGYVDGPPFGWNVLIEDGNTGGRCETPVLTSTYIYDPLAFIELNWEAIPHAVWYRLERKKGDGLYDLLEDSLSPETTSYIDMTTEYLSEYSYRLTALGNNGNYGDSELSNVVTVTALNGEIITLSPPVFELSVADRFAGSVQISWNFISGAQSYYIERKLSTDSGGEWTRIQVSSTTRQYIDTGTTYGTTYDYRMKAIGNEINIFSSDYSEVAVFEVPDPYAGLIWLNPVSISLSQVTDVNTVTASWGTNANAIGYKLERKLSSDTAWSTIYSGPATSYSDTNLTWDATYDYQITALGDYVTFRDSVPMDDSIEIERPIAQQLATPVMSGVETTVSGTKAVELTWGLVTGASSYKLERKLSTESEYTVISDQLSSMAASYTNVGLSGGKTYQYRLTALGDGLYYTNSSPSNVVEIELGWAVETVVYNNGRSIGSYNLTMSTEAALNFVGNWQSSTPSYTDVVVGGSVIAQAFNVAVSNQTYGYYIAARLQNPIDLTDYKQIVFTLKEPTSGEKKYPIPSGSIGYGISYLYTRTNVTGSKADKTTTIGDLTNDFEDYILDVSEITGERLIGIQITAANPCYNTEVWIKKIALYG